MSENQTDILQQQAADFKVGRLIGRPWAEINEALEKHKDNRFIMEKISNSKRFQEYCHEQADRFLDRRIALTEKDFEAIKILWLYGNLELDDVLTLKERAEKEDFIQTDRFRDFDEDKRIKLFAENIPDIQEELEIRGTLGPAMRTFERQLLVDYLRFMESGRRSREWIQQENWKELTKEFEHFPRMKSEFIVSLLKKEQEKSPDSERAQMMARIITYRFYDIRDGKWELKDAKELDFIEDFIKENYGKIEEDALATEVMAKIAAARETLKEQAAPKTEPQPLVIDEVEEETAPSKTNEAPQVQVKEEDTPSVEEQPEAQPEEKKEAQPEEKKEAQPEEENKKEENKKEEAEPQEKENSSWQTETLKNWKDWATDNHKWVKSYDAEDNQGGLSFKVYPNKDDAEQDKFEADIHYKEQNHVVVKGKPSNEVFDGLVAMAKKNGNQICFGNIKSDEFKARLMLACLKDGDIKMLNAPKIEDLQDIPASLKEALKNPTKERIDRLRSKKETLDGEKTPRQKGQNDKGERTSERKDNNKEKRPHHEFTDEEKQAYQKRKQRETR